MKLLLPYLALSKPSFGICRCYKCCFLLLSIFSGSIDSKSVDSNPVIYDASNLSSDFANNAVSSSNISDNQNNLTSSSKKNANSEISDNDQEKPVQPNPQSSNYNNYGENQEEIIDDNYSHYDTYYQDDGSEAGDKKDKDTGCDEMGFNCNTTAPPAPIEIENVTQKGLCEELRTPIVWTDIIVLFSVAFIAAFAPYIPWVTYNQVYISVINCIGAGILLGTCFFHYMPEVQEKYLHSTDKDGEAYDPHSLVFEMWTMAGFLLILLCEQYFTTYFSKWFSDGGFPTHCHTHGDFGTPEHAHNHRHDAQQNPETNPLPEKRGLLNDTSENTENGSDGIISSPVNLAGHEDHCHEDIQSHSALRSLAFVASLGIHSIVEGGAVIMTATSWAENQAMLISIAVHKVAVGLTMGFTLKSSNLKKRSAQIALFSWVCFSPLGGILTTGACQANIIESTVFMHLNAVGLGSFFYVLFFEIAPHEFLGSGENPSKFAKSLILVLGVAITLGMVMLFPHTHGGGGHCHNGHCH